MICCIEDLGMDFQKKTPPEQLTTFLFEIRQSCVEAEVVYFIVH